MTTLTKTQSRILLTFLCCFIIICLLYWPELQNNKPQNTQLLEKIKAQGSITILIRNAPTTYYEGREGPEGFEFHLTQAFAEHLGVSTNYVVEDNTADIIVKIENGEAHLAAAGITRTKARVEKTLVSPKYMSVKQQVVCHRKGIRPRAVQDLANVSIEVPASTSYIETLKKLKVSVPDLKWETSDTLSSEQILERVWKRKIDCSIADSNIVAINRRYYPELTIQMDLTGQQPLVWLLPTEATDLHKALNDWFSTIKANGTLEDIYQRYYSYTEIFDFVDIRAYKRRIAKRLNKYQDDFMTAAKAQQLPWTLLAAQAYQESHWDPNAISPTGVRGIMMLTRTTAKSLGVKNRTNPSESIQGGAKYLRQLLKRIPEDVIEEDRIWFALAAYNVGMGHIYDARKLATELGKSPSKWIDLKSVLPLLTQKQYYKKLKYGYARGMEPIRYVERIKDYQDILERTLAEQNQ